MPKKLTYIILANHLIYEKYGKNVNNVFEDAIWTWKEVQQFSGYWTEFEMRGIYNTKSLMTKLKRVVVETSEIPCDFNKEKLFLFSNLYCQLKIGETLFVQYDGPEVNCESLLAMM